jgi:hypothetical protein
MTRLGQWGGELRDPTAEGLTLAGTTQTYDTTTTRTGAASYKFDTSATCSLDATLSAVTGRTYYACGHIYIPSATGYPGASAIILRFLNGGTALAGAELTTTGTVLIRIFGGGTVGSASSALSQDTWHRIELSLNINAAGGADDAVALQVNDVAVASGTTTIGTGAPTTFRFGWTGDPGTSEVIYIDDLAVNDNQGSVNNTWVGDQKIYALFPASDNARGNWTDGGAGTTNLWEAVNNTPPVGILPAAGVGAGVQIQNSVAAAAANGDFNLTSYTTAGVGASDTVTAVQTIVMQGNSSTTGSDAISHAMVSNPAIATTGEVSADIVSGTYPASWNRGVGTMTENPTVTLGTQPVMRVTKVDSSTRFNAVCLMALMVSVTPGTPATPSFNYKPLRSMNRLRR